MPAGSMPTTGLPDRAGAVRALAARHADQADSSGRLAAEVVGALREAGFARHFVTARRGGTQGSFADLTRAVVTVGQGCAATAWCASLWAYAARLAAFLPADGQEAIWQAGPDAVIATARTGAGLATRTAGGWVLSGRWNHIAGVDFADWLLVRATGPDAGSRLFALPRSSYRIRPTWDGIGMRGTGSNTVVVDETTVPAQLSCSWADVLDGRGPAAGVAAAGVPLAVIGALPVIAPIAGAAAGALRSCAPAGPDDPGVVRGAAIIEAAHRLVTRHVSLIEGGSWTPETVASAEHLTTVCARSLAEAIGLLTDPAGRSGLRAALPLQRWWRDVITATGHAGLRHVPVARPPRRAATRAAAA